MGEPSGAGAPPSSAGRPRGRYVACAVDGGCDGYPLWRVLEERLGMSRAMVRRAKALPFGLLLDGAPSHTTAEVRAGQIVEANVADAPLAPGERPCVEPQPGPLDVVFEDDDLLVVDKPAGQVVHPCPGHRTATLGNFAMHHLLSTGPAPVSRLYPVHRLDLGTSGLLVYAKNAYAHGRLQASLHAGAEGGSTGGAGAENGVPGCGRLYLALCEGVFGREAGVVDAPIARVDEASIRRAVDARGKRAVTRYRVLGTMPGAGSGPGSTPGPTGFPARSWPCGSRRGGPTRYASTWRTSATRCLGTPCTAARRGASDGRHCTRGARGSSSPSPASGCCSRRPSPAIWRSWRARGS